MRNVLLVAEPANSSVAMVALMPFTSLVLILHSNPFPKACGIAQDVLQSAILVRQNSVFSTKWLNITTKNYPSLTVCPNSYRIIGTVSVEVLVASTKSTLSQKPRIHFGMPCSFTFISCHNADRVCQT